MLWYRSPKKCVVFQYLLLLAFYSVSCIFECLSWYTYLSWWIALMTSGHQPSGLNPWSSGWPVAFIQGTSFSQECDNPSAVVFRFRGASSSHKAFNCFIKTHDPVWKKNRLERFEKWMLGHNNVLVLFEYRDSYLLKCFQCFRLLRENIIRMCAL